MHMLKRPPNEVKVISACTEESTELAKVDASQISETSWFLSMPPDAFAGAFGTEWFIHRGRRPGITEDQVL